MLSPLLFFLYDLRIMLCCYFYYSFFLFFFFFFFFWQTDCCLLCHVYADLSFLIHFVSGGNYSFLFFLSE
eukprot:UN01936